MSRDNMNAQRHGEGLDADAVCAACGTVNPEGTFICRVCGNNLRDQRQRRMNAEVQLEGNEPAGADRRQILSAGLGILGILIVLWVALNVGNIEQRLFESQLGSGDAAGMLWDGPESIIFNRLIDTLLATSLTDAQINSAQENPIVGTTPDGVFVLIGPQGLAGRRMAGIAAVETQGGGVYFAAQMQNGVEIRGRADQQGDVYVASSENAAALAFNQYTGINGVAAPQVDGSYEVLGYGEGSDSQHTVLAYRLP